MREDFEKVIALVESLGIDHNVREYRGRFILQKTTFLAKSRNNF
jgi:hypothetical protein